jgi:hypothetical protein
MCVFDSILLYSVYLTHTQVTEISSVTSVLPGALVQSLITAIHPTGLNLQVLGFFEGTVDQVHLKREGKAYQVGKKVRARILYEYSSSPPRFALALVDHLTNLSAPCIKSKEVPAQTKSIQEAFPLGTIIESTKVLRVETERGVIVEVQPGVEGFVHVRMIPLFFFCSSSKFLADFPPFRGSRTIPFFHRPMESRHPSSGACNRLLQL